MDVKKKKVEYDENRKSVYKLNDESAEAAPSQVSSKTALSNSQSYSSYIQKLCGPARQVPQVNRLIVTWLADAMLPATTIGNPYFRSLIETVNNLPYKYALPHEGKIWLSVGPKVIEAVEWKICQILDDETIS
uniref:Uncharacterized protein n=1 Tax=Romanomermis culicivorax TaxID=13658 RepID=A0A915JY52_ROMCU